MPVTEAEVARRVAFKCARLRTAGWTALGHVPDTTDRDAGFPFWRVEQGELVYRVRERGQLLDERRTASVDQLLEWVFDGVTHSMATSWELQHRVEGQDSRRGWFPVWVGLMTLLDPAWGVRTQAHVDEVLARHPYRDD